MSELHWQLHTQAHIHKMMFFFFYGYHVQRPTGRTGRVVFFTLGTCWVLWCMAPPGVSLMLFSLLWTAFLAVWYMFQALGCGLQQNEGLSIFLRWTPEILEQQAQRSFFILALTFIKISKKCSLIGKNLVWWYKTRQTGQV